VYEVAQLSPLDHAKNLTEKTGNQIYLKREDLQPVFSFKLRGAYNKIVHLSPEERSAGIICSSAGNHAQGVALAASRLNLDATIVMPKTTPKIKVGAVKQYGGNVVLHGDSYSEAALHCEAIIRETGKVYIHPFDDPHVIAGQGTIGHELMQQLPDLDIVFVPVGGGGLISGIALYLKFLRPDVKVIGVEPVDSNAMKVSLDASRRIELPSVGIFADGVAVKIVGKKTFEIVQKYVDEVIEVSNDEICSAIKSIYNDTRSIVEPAGALGVAGIEKYVRERNLSGKKIVAINSGANMNFERLQFVAERTQIGERNEALFAVTIPEKSGALKDFCLRFISDRSITEFNYRLMGRNDAHIFVGIGIDRAQERDSFCRDLQEAGYGCSDLTDNELAKTHIRHMVGGRSDHTREEVLYRFQFPERPGALTEFLAAMPESWNISLFHYRMHGGDFGRVLIGFEIPVESKGEFHRFLDQINYGYVEESENEAYRLFL